MASTDSPAAIINNRFFISLCPLVMPVMGTVKSVSGSAGDSLSDDSTKMHNRKHIFALPPRLGDDGVEQAGRKSGDWVIG